MGSDRHLPPLQMPTWVNIFTISQPRDNGDDHVFLGFFQFGSHINHDYDCDIIEDDGVIVNREQLYVQISQA